MSLSQQARGGHISLQLAPVQKLDSKKNLQIQTKYLQEAFHRVYSLVFALFTKCLHQRLMIATDILHSRRTPEVLPSVWPRCDAAKQHMRKEFSFVEKNRNIMSMFIVHFMEILSDAAAFKHCGQSSE